MATEMQTKQAGTELMPQMEAVQLTATGLTFTREVSFDEWSALGERLRSLGNAVQFWIGDWIRYGEHKFGEKYKQAIAATSLEAGTLRNVVYVAEHVEMSRRRDKLPFSHHQEVAALKPAAQSALLDMAERQGLTREQLRDEVRAYKEIENPKPQGMPEPESRERSDTETPDPEPIPNPAVDPEPAVQDDVPADEIIPAIPYNPTPEPTPTEPTAEEVTHGERILRMLVHPGMALFRSSDGGWSAWCDDVEGPPARTASEAIQGAIRIAKRAAEA